MVSHNRYCLLTAAWIGAGRVWYVSRNLGLVEEFIEGSRTARGNVCFDLGEDMVKPSRRGIRLNLTAQASQSTS